MSEIVIGYDGSDSSKSALAQALDSPRRSATASWWSSALRPADMAGARFRSRGAAVEEFGRKVTAEAVEAAKATKVDCTVEMINEHSYEALITIADKHDARMIVVGSHGDSPIKGAILGETPYKLVQLSERPVLVVRA